MIRPCFALDPATGDLAVPIRLVRGAEAVLQRIRIRFRWFLGEWFLDQREGVPYFRDVLVKNPDPVLISSIFRTVLRRTPGVLRIDRFAARLERNTRTLIVDFEVTLETGETLTVADDKFIIG